MKAKKADKSFEARESWLIQAMGDLRVLFKEHGYDVPKNVRVSCGWPSVSARGGKKQRIGEAWASTASNDKHFEIFISPILDKPVKVLDVLVHELVHVTVGLAAGHKGAFMRCAQLVGLEGKMTATVASPVLRKRLTLIADGIGRYPHATINTMTNGRKKQSTRLIKAYCEGCTYTVRASLKWLLQAVPVCPLPPSECVKSGKAFYVEYGEDEEKGE